LAVALRDGLGAVWQIALSNLGFLALLSPKILCGLFVASALPLLIPREHVISLMGRDSGLRGLGLGTLAGMLVPGGPVMTFALAASFLTAGASRGVLIAFITAWSLLGLNRTIIWEMSFLSTEFVALRYLLCLPLPILAGLLARALLPE